MKSLAEESSGTGVSVAEPASPETSAPSILMVDDQPARLLTYEAILSGMPIHCVRAHSGEEALQLLLKQSFALILLDVNMPGMDGFEVARHVRAHSRLGKMPIIFVTGERLDDLDRLKGYEVGAVDYIGVPIVPEILRSKVALLVELYHRRSQLEQLARTTAEARRPELIVEEGANPVQLRAVFDQSPDIQFILRGERDAQGRLSSWRYVDANGSALRLYGRKREEIVGRTVAEAFPERAVRAEMLCQRALLDGERFQYETDYEGRRLLVRVFAVDDACVALTCTDITTQRDLQAALTDADRRKDEFLAMLAHELRNPVAPIVNVAQVLALKMKDDPQGAGLISIVQRQVGHLARLLDDLLDVARITRGRIELRREILNVNECVSVASETVEPLLRSGQHRLEISRAPEVLVVDADRVRITQCLTNLLNNAAKYSASGATIQVRTYASQDRAVIEVRDQGRGISPDVLPKIFELFAQDQRSLDRKSGGLGIGLSVCKRLVEMHGGSVTAHSEGVGRGATFTLSLPLVRPSASKPAAGNPDASAPRRRVFVVDDNADAADSIAMLLELSGHETRVVYAGEEALASCAAFAPHVVLLDIGLPGMDGYELIRKLRDAGFTGHAIALSGYGQAEDKQKAMRAGFDAHLVKPVDLGTLEKALARAL